MAQIKRVKTSEKAHKNNTKLKNAIKNAIKKVKIAVQNKNKTEADGNLKNVISLLDKSVNKHVKHKNNANRYKSKMTILVNSLKN